MAKKKTSTKATPVSSPSLSDAPARLASRSPILRRGVYDLSDYGLRISQSVEEHFEVVPSVLSEEEAFLFFFLRDDLHANHYSLFNLHVFLKRTGTLEDFARSLGESVRRVPLQPTRVLGLRGLTYSRRIAMKNLFAGAPQVIKLIGGVPELDVRDSHTYFIHRHNHYYMGMMHTARQNRRYDKLRSQLLKAIQLV